jgi:hypothetical protein
MTVCAPEAAANRRKDIETADELVNLYLFHSKYQSREWSDE